MRLRRVTPLLAAAAVLLTAVPAVAEQTEEAAPPAAASDHVRSVILPTGDRVSLLPGGRYGYEPAVGREEVGHLSATALDGSGDVSFIPADVAGDFAGGGLDPRRFNVSALMRAGITDAASAVLTDERPYEGLVPAGGGLAEDETRAVTVTFRDRAGLVPDTVRASIVSADGMVWEGVYLDGTASGTVELPPGEYGLTADVITDPAGDHKGAYVAAVKRFTVGDGPLSVTVDGRKSALVGTRVDRETTPGQREILLSWTSGGEEPGEVAAGASFGADHKMYATPSADPAVHFAHAEIRRSPSGTVDPYTYRLLFLESGKVPADLFREVDDGELAEVAVEYGGFGKPVSGAGLCMSQGHADRRPSPSCVVETVSLPYRGTDLFVADPRLTNTPVVEFWDRTDGVSIGYAAEQRSFTAGRHAWRLGTGPLTYGIQPYAAEDPDGDKGASGNYRTDDLLYFGFDQLGEGSAGETYWMYGGGLDDSPMDNVVVITKDDAEINRIEGDVNWFDTGLYPGEAGRYRLTIDGGLDIPWSNLLTESTLDWEFETAPAEPGVSTPLPFSLVLFGADDVFGGVADRDAPQKVTLDYTSQPGGTEATASSLGLEISYDEGATWTAVGLTRDGDHATATLHHPAGAEFVSVRTSATDDLGSAVTQTTVRTYALD
ncbi:hypothetical protein AB0I28_38040 [Phytomonospora sp. NPDC050363]|uniref:hypothetical protein n=1 Tax=Phytomonospora sp. NPDC050363 TaxID=3155642 RepID=UPI0033DB10D7